LRLVLEGPAAGNGGIRMVRSSASLGPTGQPAMYQGQITALDGTTLVAEVRDGAGRSVALTVQLEISGTAVTGTVQAAAGPGG
jgi:hypothetical protein